MEFSLDTVVLKPLLSMIVEMLKWSIELFPNVGGEFFSLTIVQQILGFFQYLMYGMFVIGTSLALIDFVISYIDGGKPSAMTMMKSICKGLFAALFMQKIILLAYETIYFFTQKFFLFQSATNEMFSVEKIAEIFHYKSDNQMIGLVVVSMLTFLILGIFFQFLERNGLFLLHQGTSIFFIISICRGHETAFSTWMKQGVILCFMNFMQMLLFVIALVMLQQPMTAFVAVGLMFSAYRIEKVVTLLPRMQQTSLKQYALIQTAKDAFNRSAVIE